MLHDVMPLISTLHIHHASQLRVRTAVGEQLRDVKCVYIHNMFSLDYEFDDLEVDHDTVIRLVPFLTQLPKLEHVYIGGRGFVTCYLRSLQKLNVDPINVDGTAVGSLNYLMDSFSGSFDCGALGQSLNIVGLVCPHVVDEEEDSSYPDLCSVCTRACELFPLNALWMLTCA